MEPVPFPVVAFNCLSKIVEEINIVLITPWGEEVTEWKLRLSSYSSETCETGQERQASWLTCDFALGYKGDRK